MVLPLFFGYAMLDDGMGFSQVPWKPGGSAGQSDFPPIDIYLPIGTELDKIKSNVLLRAGRLTFRRRRETA
ncbi:hypothetical protein D9M68_493680 [compost metagenome]